MIIARLAGILAMGLLAGCSIFGGDEAAETPIEQRPASEIFAQGEALLAEGDPVAAARTFGEIERLYPFSQFAKRALVMSAFSAYEAGRYGDARAAAQRYVDLYPADKDAAYAQYLIALTHYDNITDVERDQGTTRAALDEALGAMSALDVMPGAPVALRIEHV